MSSNSGHAIGPAPGSAPTDSMVCAWQVPSNKHFEAQEVLEKSLEALF